VHFKTSNDKKAVSHHWEYHDESCSPVTENHYDLDGTDASSFQAVSVSALSDLPSSRSKDTPTNVVHLSGTATLPQLEEAAAVGLVLHMMLCHVVV
jgi:hypothetical protein